MNFYDDLKIPFAMHVPDGHHRTHIPLYYGIQYNHAGTFQLQIDHGPLRTFSGPTVFITHPGSQFSYRLLPGEQHFYYAVCFTGERIRKFLENGLLSLEPECYPIRNSGKFMQTILELIEMRNNGQHAHCVNLLESLLIQIQTQTKRNAVIQSPYQEDALKELAEKIRKNCAETWNFSLEAKKLFISERHFRTLFTQVNEFSPLHFLIRARLEKAAVRLVHSKETINIIADECGFKDEFYFSRLFKKYYHLSPKQYREEFGSFR